MSRGTGRKDKIEKEGREEGTHDSPIMFFDPGYNKFICKAIKFSSTNSTNYFLRGTEVGILA
jgi:hypothetical protein